MGIHRSASCRRWLELMGWKGKAAGCCPRGGSLVITRAQRCLHRKRGSFAQAGKVFDQGVRQAPSFLLRAANGGCKQETVSGGDKGDILGVDWYF